jgi:hypothetical protein
MDVFSTITSVAFADDAFTDDGESSSSPRTSPAAGELTQPLVDFEKTAAPDNGYNAWCVVA